MNDYEAQRQANITRNKALIQELGIPTLPSNNSQRARGNRNANANANSTSSRVKRSVRAEPSRTSARIAAAPARTYNEDEIRNEIQRPRGRRQNSSQSASRRTVERSSTPENNNTAVGAVQISPLRNVADLQAQWRSWTPTGPDPERDESGTVHFADEPGFTPNKTPEEILREGAFGGSYFRPYYSSHLRVTVDDDWDEVPEPWRQGLDVDRFLRSPDYDPEVNKFGVACGQSLEAWEAAGWMNHEHDIRGWFQWYMRFYMGRRCDDDARQIGRWSRCVGERGRWKRTLLKQYLTRGIRSVFDDGEEQEVDVSPVVSQTCHHWAYEVKQEDLDQVWTNGLR